MKLLVLVLELSYAILPLPVPNGGFYITESYIVLYVPAKIFS